MSRDPKREIQSDLTNKYQLRKEFNQIRETDGQCSVVTTKQVQQDLNKLLQKPIIKRQKSVGSKNIINNNSSNNEEHHNTLININGGKNYPQVATVQTNKNNSKQLTQVSDYLYQGGQGGKSGSTKKNQVTQSFERISVSREGFNYSN